ncbi:MAG: type II secretion system secretin GspD [Marinibacterium sp.]
MHRLVAAICIALAALSHSLSAQSRLDLRNVDLEGFVRIIAEETGRTFVLDPSAQGSVTVVAPEDVSRAALFEIFLNVLELNGLTIVEGQEADRIVPNGAASRLSAGTSGRGAVGFETRVVPLKSADASDIAEVIRPLLADQAVLSVVPASQVLIISDRAENLNRIAKVIARLDRPNGAAVETIRVRNGNAQDLVQIIARLDIAPQGATLSADTRSNAIAVSGPAGFRLRIRQLVEELDTPQRSVVTRVVHLAYADAAQLEEVIARSFGNPEIDDAGNAVNSVSIVADTQSNALIITAPSDRIQNIVQSVHALDSRPSQVLIEGLIFELSVQTFSDLSVQFGAVLNNAVVGGVQFSLDGRTTLSAALSAASQGTAPAVGNGGIIGGGNLSDDGDGFVGFLTALNQESTTRVLSTPSLLTLDNQEAEIVVAQNVPFVTGSYSTVGNSAVPDQPFQTIERKDVGLTLRVIPQITIDGTVRLAINQEVSNLTSSSSEAGGEITAKRSIRTNVIVRNGRVIMLGGLLEDGNGSVGQSVPGVSNLPVIGNLFRGRNASKDQRILLVMLRPRVIGSDSEAQKITREVARDTRRASRLIQPLDDGKFPAVPDGTFPFDGADLNQAFDAGIVDTVAIERMFPPLPSRLRFREGTIGQ